MRVYVAIPADTMDFDEVLVASSRDGIKDKCEEYCRVCLGLVNIQTEVTCDETKVFVHITGEDPEELYTFDGIFDDTVEFLMRIRETE